MRCSLSICIYSILHNVDFVMPIFLSVLKRWGCVLRIHLPRWYYIASSFKRTVGVALSNIDPIQIFRMPLKHLMKKRFLVK